jgi:hypothetical protein
VEIVGGAGEGLGAAPAGVKRALFRAILESERLHLDTVQPLIDRLLERVEAMPG